LYLHHRESFSTETTAADSILRSDSGWKSLETMLRYLADVDVKDSVQAMGQAVKKLATA
jgi:hypothetical protein